MLKWCTGSDNFTGRLHNFISLPLQNMQKSFHSHADKVKGCQSRERDRTKQIGCPVGEKRKIKSS